MALYVIAVLVLIAVGVIVYRLIKKSKAVKRRPVDWEAGAFPSARGEKEKEGVDY